MNSTRTFRLRLFGSPSIVRENGEPVTGRAAQRHRLALLAVLAVAHPRPSTRDRVMALLWPRSGTERARQLLNQAVYNLRKELGEEAILTARDELRFNPRIIGCDVLDFEEAIATGTPAVEHYAGPFLDGFFLSEAPDFEHWADQERTRLAASHGRALEALAGAAEQRGDLAGAVSWWNARAAQDPYDSRIALRLMRALEADGNRAAALQHAAIHQRLLHGEFDAEPDPEVLALAERLRTEPAPRAPGAARPSAAPRARPPPDATATPAAPEPADVPVTLERPRPGATPEQSAAPAPTAMSARAERPAVARPPPRLVGYAAGAVALALMLFAASRLPRPAASPAAGEASIAVLPLTSLSADPRDAVLADGMTEALIAMLGRIPGLRVIASTSVAGFRDRPGDVRGIADSLHVSHLLEGGVQRIGTRIRVRVRLVDGRDGSTRWSESYERELQDVFAVQDDIARAVGRELGVRLGVAAGAPLRRQPTSNVAAYELYLRGNDPAVLRSDSAAREGLEYFRQAIALDPAYAAAHAGLARLYIRVAMGDGRADASFRDWLTRAEEAASEAMALDPALAEAHATLGAVREAAYDYASAERHYRQAIALDPPHAVAREWLVGLLLLTGRHAEALAEADRALAVAPLAPSAHAERARALLANDRCDEALAQLDRIAAVQPPLLRVAPIAAECYARQQRWAEAVAVLRPGADRGGSTARARLGNMLARAGHTEEALRIRAALLEQWRRDGSGAFEVAVVNAGLRDFDEAFLWLERAIDDRASLPSRRHAQLLEFTLDELRRDPRFGPLAERLAGQNR